jgi:hypothetical protein
VLSATLQVVDFSELKIPLSAGQSGIVCGAEIVRTVLHLDSFFCSVSPGEQNKPER